MSPRVRRRKKRRVRRRKKNIRPAVHCRLPRLHQSFSCSSILPASYILYYVVVGNADSEFLRTADFAGITFACVAKVEN
ncbi:hypothetical protein ACQJBY_049499 [Aegilops geniculata]